MSLPAIFIVSTSTIDGKVRGHKKGQRLSTIYPLPEKVLKEIHFIRSQADAIMVGANTVRLDNPLLTVRYIKTEKTPVRIALSKECNLNPNSNIFNDEAKTILITTQNAPSNRIAQFSQKGIKIIISGHLEVDLKSAFLKIQKMGIKKIMVEGGPTLISQLINQKLVKEMIIITYPVILGNNRGIPELFSSQIKVDVVTNLLKTTKIENFTFRYYRFNIE